MWIDIDHIRRDFELDANSDEADIKATLRKSLKELHPDITGGVFLNDKQKLLFEKTKAALDFLRDNIPARKPSELLQVVEQQNALVAQALKSQELIVTALNRAQEDAASLQREKRITSLEGSARALIREQAKRHNRPFTISGASLAGLAALLLAFKAPLEELSKSSILSSIPHGQLAATICIVYLGLIAGIFAFISHRREHREMDRKERILTEAGFRAFLFSKQMSDALEWHYEEEASSQIVSLAKLTDAAADFAGMKGSSSAQAVAEVFYQRLIERKLAVPLEGGFISPTLKLTEGIESEILYGNHEKKSSLD